MHVCQKVLLGPPLGCPKPETQVRLREEASVLQADLDFSCCRRLLVTPCPAACTAQDNDRKLNLNEAPETLSKCGLENKCQTLLPSVHCNLGMATSFSKKWCKWEMPLQCCKNGSCALNQRGTQGSWWPIPALALLALHGQGLSTLGQRCWGTVGSDRVGGTGSCAHNLSAAQSAAVSWHSLAGGELILKAFAYL